MKIVKSLVLGVILLAVLGVVRTLTAPRTALAQPGTVADSVITDCSDDTQLRTAVTAGGTITFNCGVGTHTILINGYMQVPLTTTIMGNDQIVLDGGGSSAFFQVYASSAMTLTNMTLMNGRFNAAHALENFGRLTLDGVSMRNNSSTSDGGAIANYNTLTVTNSIFVGNSATSHGGAIVSEGESNLTVINTTFNDNLIEGVSISGQVGGAIAVLGGHYLIDHSFFNGNSAVDGGALYLETASTGTVSYTLFDSNQAGYGGAIESAGQLDINNSTIYSNSTTSGQGGGIWIVSGDTDIAYTTIRHNHAILEGGGVHCQGTNLSIIHSTLNDNTSATSGGGVYSMCNLNITNNTFSHNQAVNGGGGIFQIGGGTGSVVFTTFAHNSASFGGAVYNDGGGGGSSLSLQNTLLVDNSPNCDGVITSLGYNFSSDNNCAALTQTGDQQGLTNLYLGPLGYNGGPTFTHYPLPGNPAINAVPLGLCGFSSDQRDVARPSGGACDIGSVEVDRYLAYLPLAIK